MLLFMLLMLQSLLTVLAAVLVWSTSSTAAWCVTPLLFFPGLLKVALPFGL
jgi:hypothetical protein